MLMVACLECTTAKVLLGVLLRGRMLFTNRTLLLLLDTLEVVMFTLSQRLLPEMVIGTATVPFMLTILASL
jgi:hypothetical protein